MTTPTTTPSPIHLLGSTVIVGAWYYAGVVIAKVKGVDAYVVKFQSMKESQLHRLISKRGLPNRHLELEWGNWSGSDTEFVIHTKDMQRV
jgi:hypothetical protein